MVGLKKTYYPTSEEDISDEVALEVCVVLMNTSTVEFDVVVNLAVSDGTASTYVTEIERIYIGGGTGGGGGGGQGGQAAPQYFTWGGNAPTQFWKLTERYGGTPIHNRLFAVY